MLENQLKINLIRQHLYNENLIYLFGYYTNGGADNNRLKIMADNEELSYKQEFSTGYAVKAKYVNVSDKIDTETVILIEVPQLSRYSKFKIINYINGEEDVVLDISTEELINKINKINYNIDRESKIGNDYHIDGWIMYDGNVSLRVFKRNKKEIPCTITSIERNDVKSVYPELKNSDLLCGFNLQFKTDSRKILLEIGAGDKKEEITVDLRKYMQGEPGKIHRSLAYLKKNGIRAFAAHAARKLKNKNVQINNEISYEEWLVLNEVKQNELKQQEQTKFKKNIKFSIVVPLYNTPEKYFRELIRSIKSQTYSNWELCFADGSSDRCLENVLREKDVQDKRIKYKKLEDNKGISENTNVALHMADGDYIVLADHDDLLAPNALYEFMRIIEEHTDADAIYSDEDKISMDGTIRFEPHFKPDFNIDLLCSVNYICHLFTAKKELVDKIGDFRKEYDGAQDYDFIFRCVENSKKVYHVPKILYHWRSHINSTAENPESKLYAFEAGKRAIKEHFNRIGLSATIEDGPAYGLYHSKIEVIGEPLVSVVIPNKDHIEDLDKCIQSIIKKTNYKKYEIIVIENNSTLSETFEYYTKIEKNYDNIKVVYWKDEFNYSLINNFGVKYTNGEYILFLNNDTEVINGTWMEEMLGYCQRDDVGIVGSKLYYSDDTIQHAGVVIGFGGIAGHTFIGQGRYEFGYFARAMCIQDYSAVTAACMMTKKKLFLQVGGFTDILKVAFNDIDYCLKIRDLGKLVVYNAYAELYHYESKSRGLEDTPEKIKRFNGEIDIFQKRWKGVLDAGDPFYNPNLALNRSDFALRS